jgi:hypothetical protein
MARKAPPPVSYGDDLALPGAPPPPSSAPPTADTEPSEDASRPKRRPILEKSDPTIVYLDPRGKHQLRHYAVSQGLKVRVHDLLLEAIEEWAERRGLPGPFRSPSSKPRRTT